MHAKDAIRRQCKQVDRRHCAAHQQLVEEELADDAPDMVGSAAQMGNGKIDEESSEIWQKVSSKPSHALDNLVMKSNFTDNGRCNGSANLAAFLGAE